MSAIKRLFLVVIASGAITLTISGQQTERTIGSEVASAAPGLKRAPVSVSPRVKSAKPARPAQVRKLPQQARESTRLAPPDSVKQAKPRVDSTTPGVDSDAWLTSDPVLGGADRIDGREADKFLVTFTFDDGPDRNTTGVVLDALARYDIPASFFVVTRRLLGKSGEVPRALMERAYREGHLIGSHTVSHRRLSNATDTLLAEEVDASLKTMVRVSGRSVGLFRPPFGSLSKAGSQWLAKRGLTNTLWSIDTLDWQAREAAGLRAKVLRMIVRDEGGVVLMHDVKKMTADIIAGVFDDLEGENCARLSSGRPPIIPVSLHYFLQNGKQPRPVLESVQARTAAYRAALPARCATRRTAQPVLPSAADPVIPVMTPITDPTK